jgi:hypothetical protein
MVSPFDFSAVESDAFGFPESLARDRWLAPFSEGLSLHFDARVLRARSGLSFCGSIGTSNKLQFARASYQPGEPRPLFSENG